MSTDNSFTKQTITERPLHAFLHGEYPRFIAEPARLLGPLIRCLESIHQSGNSHGAVTPTCMMVSPTGEINVGFFKGRAGNPDAAESLTYYPNGLGDTVESRQFRDVQALGAILHLIVAGHLPVSPERGRKKLAENSAAKDWPCAFIDLIDRILSNGAEENGVALSELAHSLMIPTSVAGPAMEEIVASNVPAVRLPNGMVGRTLNSEIAPAFASGSPSVGRITLLGVAPAGLEFQDGWLRGIPEIAGEYDLKFQLEAEPGGADVSIPSEWRVGLTINSDPRSLWKNIPSDDKDEYWKPDEVTDFLTEGPLCVIGASLRGRTHAHVGSFRDDDMAMAWYPSASCYSLTVADGAGSSKYSRRGSKIACDTVQSWFANYFAAVEPPLTQLVAAYAQAECAGAAALMHELYHVFGNAAMEARKAIASEAVTKHATAKDFHTTLITALLHLMPDGRWFVATFSIGDGAAAVVSKLGEKCCLLTCPDGGDYAGQTKFLTMDETFATGEMIMGRIRMEILPEWEALLLMTDGISDPRFESEADLANPAAWSRLWDEVKNAMASSTSQVAAAAAVLKWMEFHSKGHHDDRTLLMATPSSIFSPS
jgi:serine/threonine protein phosphatase PrpC